MLIEISTTQNNHFCTCKTLRSFSLCLILAIRCWHITCSILFHKCMAMNSLFEKVNKVDFLLISCLCKKQKWCLVQLDISLFCCTLSLRLESPHTHGLFSFFNHSKNILVTVSNIYNSQLNIQIIWSDGKQ